MIRNAVSRINDIANTLLKKSMEKRGAPGEEKSRFYTPCSPPVEPLITVVDTLISEKRVQYQNRPEVQIDFDFESAIDPFVSLDSSELKRVLSNVINNSVEAISPGTKGTVTVSLKSNQNRVAIQVVDNGKGIRKELLQKLGQVEVSEGKDGDQSGSGLGVYHARKVTESFGGRFEIFSKEHHGTTVTLEFPTVDPHPTSNQDLLQRCF